MQRDMRRLLFIILFLFTTGYLFCQELFTTPSFYSNGKQVIQFSVGRKDNNYYVLIGAFCNKEPITRPNETFIVATEYDNITFVVTEDLLNKKDENGLLLFPIDIKDVRKIATGFRRVIYGRGKFKKMKYLYDYNNDIKEKTSTLLHIDPRTINTNSDSRIKKFPSWRD